MSSSGITIEITISSSKQIQTSVGSAAKPTRSYHGTTIEDPTASITVKIYDDGSPHRHQPGSSTTIIPASDRHTLSQLDMLLAAPITELVFLTYKPTGSPLNTVKPLVEHQQTLPNVRGAIWGPDTSPAAKGTTGDADFNDGERCIALVGWDSVKDHTDTVSTPDFQAYIAKCGSAAQIIVMYHVPLQPVQE
jgi:hypothetical protein